MKKLAPIALIVGLAACTQMQAHNALDAITDNALCVSQNFDLPWEQVLLKCALRGENLTYLEKLWASSRATARRASDAGNRLP